MSDQTIGFLIVLGFLAVVWWWDFIESKLGWGLAYVRAFVRGLRKRRRERKAQKAAVAQGSCPHTRLHQHASIADLRALCLFEESDFLLEFTCKDCGACRGRLSGPVRLQCVDPNRFEVLNMESP